MANNFSIQKIESVPGSVADLALRNNVSLAESIMAADHFFLVDISGSMSANDAEGGQQRWEVARKEMEKLQARLPGKVALIAWEDKVEFCPGGILPYPRGTTDLAGALTFVYDSGLDEATDITIHVISDGEPNEPERAMQVAKQFRNIKINTVYVGAPHDHYGGQEFLKHLAATSGGGFSDAHQTLDLDTVIARLTAGTKSDDEGVIHA
jgi:hypothetical protein